MPEYKTIVESKQKKIELVKKDADSFTAKLGGKTLNLKLQNKTDSSPKFTMEVDGKPYKIELMDTRTEGPRSIKVEGVVFETEVTMPIQRQERFFDSTSSAMPLKASTTTESVKEDAVAAPMTGKVISIKIKKGDNVTKGQTLCVIEAMKMENEIAASKAGSVKEVYVTEGAAVSEGQALFLID